MGDGIGGASRRNVMALRLADVIPFQDCLITVSLFVSHRVLLLKECHKAGFPYT